WWDTGTENCPELGVFFPAFLRIRFFPNKQCGVSSQKWCWLSGLSTIPSLCLQTCVLLLSVGSTKLTKLKNKCYFGNS
ncbi:mCG145309, partial [Mus musculus]